MRKLSHVIVAGIIVGELFAVISCSRSVATKPSAQPTPSTTKTDIDIAEIKNLSLEVELWSCEDDRQADQRRKFLFREALETLKSKFPQWNIANNPAGPSEKDGRYALDISIECCGVDEEGTPGFCLDVRIWSPDGNHWNKYSSVSRDIEGEDFGK